jgi:MFS transporter, SP family, arabinose:H+ symporter
MVCFAILCVAAIGFVYRFLPETKGLSVEGAVRVFEREATGSGTTPRGRFPRPLHLGRVAP